MLKVCSPAKLQTLVYDILPFGGRCRKAMLKVCSPADVCRASCPRMSVDMLGTNCDHCLSMVQCCFTSTETVRLIRTESSGRPPRLSHSSWPLQPCSLPGRAEDPPAPVFSPTPLGCCRTDGARKPLLLPAHHSPLQQAPAPGCGLRARPASPTLSTVSINTPRPPPPSSISHQRTPYTVT